MKPGFGPTELQRAMARDDKDDLLHSVEVYRRWSGYGEPDDSKAARSDKVSDDATAEDELWHDELDPWFEPHDPERGLALIALAMANYDDEGFLALISAGMLEEIVSHNPASSGEPLRADILARIVDEARRTARFRWILSGVWTSGCPQEVTAAIKQAVGTVNIDADPLPPRPYT